MTGPGTTRRAFLPAAALAGAAMTLPARMAHRRAVTAAAPANVFNLDDFGADPTGATLSDSAWMACYAAAAAAEQAHSGAVVVAGAGFYQFSPGAVAVTDGRIGLTGQGRAATTFFTTGSGGTLIAITYGANATSLVSPLRGFSPRTGGTPGTASAASCTGTGRTGR